MTSEINPCDRCIKRDKQLSDIKIAGYDICIGLVIERFGAEESGALIPGWSRTIELHCPICNWDWDLIETFVDHADGLGIIATARRSYFPPKMTN